MEVTRLTLCLVCDPGFRWEVVNTGGGLWFAIDSGCGRVVLMDADR